MQKIIAGKRFGDKNEYYFLDDGSYQVGDKLVVNFEDFQTIITITKNNIQIDDRKALDLQKVTRIATEKDLKKYNELLQKAQSELPSFKKKSLELGLMMKFVSAEYSLDGSKIIIVFSSEDRVDFRQFLKDLAAMLKTRIELKQIGQRDEVKILGGVGPCGEPCCCARFLKDFEHVTVKMAKIQGLSLSPTKINGICGRLMCCLGYETKVYEEILAKMPKINSEVITPKGKGTVVYNDILRERVSVKRQAEGDTFVVEDYELEELGKDGISKQKKTENKTLENSDTIVSAKNDDKSLGIQENVKQTKQVQENSNNNEKHKFNKNHKRHFGNKNNTKPYSKEDKKG